MDASTFAAILAELIARIPGAFAAVLVDPEGEAVDYAGRGAPFDLKLAAAHWQIVAAEAARFVEAARWGALASVVVRGAKRSFIVHALAERYTLVVLLGRRAGFSAVHRAFSMCERALAQEAGWRAPKHAGWYPVDVRVNRAKRPARVIGGGIAHEVEVLGALRGAGGGASSARGFRVRTPAGREFTVVREPGGCWYADDDLDRA